MPPLFSLTLLMLTLAVPLIAGIWRSTTPAGLLSGPGSNAVPGAAASAQEWRRRLSQGLFSCAVLLLPLRGRM